jgi:hypothetical protein
MAAHSADPKHHSAHSLQERMVVIIFKSDTKGVYCLKQKKPSQIRRLFVLLNTDLVNAE